MYQAMYPSNTKYLEENHVVSPLLSAGRVEEKMVSRYLAKLVGGKHVFASGRRQIRPLGGGFNNRLYEIEIDASAYVIKIYPIDRMQRLDCEFAAMEQLSFLDTVPNVVIKDRMAVELSAPVLIYEKLPGLSMDPASISLEDLEALLETWVKVHGITFSNATPLAKPAGPASPEDCLRYIDKNLYAMATSDAMHESSFRNAIDRLNDQRRCLALMNLNLTLWNESHFHLCHGDCRPSNLLRMGPGRIGLVDWEHAGTVDPFFEVASFFTHPESIKIATCIRERALESYCERSDDPYSFEKLNVYQTILPFQWAVRILSLIVDYDRQVVQSWNKKRPKEALWSDLDYYSRLASQKLAERVPELAPCPG